ncbi:MAG: hypothetical protein HON04_02465 [Planctomicrobium sp.]|jgi:hypothetical protein|nr:hypothetical protein [Planctomicrobium sp.]
MFEEMIGEVVVLDMQSPFVFIGTLSKINTHDVVLNDVDVHDLRDSSTSREVYVHEIRLHGLAANRKRVVVRNHQIVSASRLNDVLS